MDGFFCYSDVDSRPHIKGTHIIIHTASLCVFVMIRYDRRKDLGDYLSVADIPQVPNYKVTHLIVSLLP